MDEQESSRAEVTRILVAINAGDSSAVERLIPLVYDELRYLEGRFLTGSTPTAPFSPPIS